MHALFDELRLRDRVEDGRFVLKVQPFVVISNHVKTKGMEPARHFLLCVSKQSVLKCFVSASRHPCLQTEVEKKLGG